MARAYMQNAKFPKPQIVPFSIDSFYGGLNNESNSALVLHPSESPDLLNVVIDERILKKRKGYVKFIETQLGAIPRRIFIYEKRDGTRKYLVCTDTKLYLMNINDETFTEIKTVARPIDGLTYKDLFLFVDGTGYYEYNGTTITPIVNASYVPTTNELNDTFKGNNTVPQDCTLIALKENRVWLAGSLSLPNVAFHSDLNNHKYFPANGFVPPITNDDQTITGLEVYMDTLTIFKQDSVFVLYGNNPDPTGYEPFSLKKANVQTGTLSPRSVTQVENFLYYLGTDGNVYSLYPTKTDVLYVMGKNISSKINLFKYPISTVEQPLLTSDLANAHAIYHKGHYYLSIADRIILTYNYQYQSWSLYKGINATDFIVDNYELLFVSKEKYVYRYDVGYNDDGQAIDAYWYSKVYDFESPSQIKQFRKIFVTAQTSSDFISSLSLIFKIDFIDVPKTIPIKATKSVWGRSKWGDLFVNTDLAQSPPINVNQRGKMFQVKIANNILDETFFVLEVSGRAELRQIN